MLVDGFHLAMVLTVCQVEFDHPELGVDPNAILEKSAGGGHWMTLRWQECRIITVLSLEHIEFDHPEIEFDPKAIPKKSAGGGL